MTRSGGLLSAFRCLALGGETGKQPNRKKDLNVRYFTATTASTIIVQRLLANRLS